jgi:hypothetical protein
MKEMKFTWELCEQCGPFVRCPKCGNNCCNGGYGKVDGKECDVCPLSYQYQELGFLTKCVPAKETLKLNPGIEL